VSYRSDEYIERPGLGSIELDPALIGDHPTDWATAAGMYVLSIIPDPLDTSRPKTAWVLLTSGALAGNYGYYGRD
jgi:hypothetical protein